MRGETYQALVLTVTGNAFLQGREIGPFWPDAAAFAFCDTVRFAGLEGEIAADPDLWLEQLLRERARLRLGVVSRNEAGTADRMGAAFANGGPRWLIESAAPGRRPDWWEPEWRVTGDPAGPVRDRRIWSVTYWRQAASEALPATRPLAELFAELGKTVDALAAFVERAAPAEAMPGWAENFREARKIFDADDGQYRSGDPGPEGFLPAEAYRMLHACRAAWVFGGMGSWNDGAYWGSIEPEGDRLSEELFHLLQQGLVAVADSTALSS